MSGEIRKAFASLGGLATLGISCGVCVAIGIYLGLSLDKYFGSHPYGVFAGIIFGILAAGRQLWVQISKSLRQFERDKEQHTKENKDL